MKTLAWFVAAAVLMPAAAPQNGWRVSQLAISAPSTLTAIEGAALTGQPSRLAWSPDATELYFQTRDGAFNDVNAPLRHFVVTVADGTTNEVQGEPDWALDYWTVKSAQVSPDDPSIRVKLKSESRRQQTTSIPTGGDLARGGTTPTNDSVDAAFSSQMVFTHTMTLYGRQVGQFENTVIVPGLTFGWGPPLSRLVAFTAPGNGRVVVMDEKGARRDISGTKDSLLPAWSPDGTRVAWVRKDGRRKVLLQVSRVERS
jgi:dipeptidyl aminopeptidase/acylaminoacyl peptidase